MIAAAELPSTEVEERALCGLMMRDPDSLSEVVALVSPKSFGDPVCRSIFETVLQLSGAGGAFDLASVTAAAHASGRLEALGGPAGLSGCLTMDPPRSSIPAYARAISAVAARRALYSAAEALARGACDRGVSVEDAAAKAADAVSSAVDTVSTVGLARPQAFGFQEMYDFLPGSDPTAVIGAGGRYLCRGSNALFVGPSGVGKSSLRTQLAITWALGRDFYGVAPVRPLKSVVVQAENDLGDEAEMIQGVLLGLGMPRPDELAERYRVFRLMTVGDSFVRELRDLIARERPDVLWIDPLMSFAGCDLSLQREASEFLRHKLLPVLIQSGAVTFFCHHVGKPKQRDAQGEVGFMEALYSAFGSSDLVNAARAVLAITADDKEGGNFELRLVKRGRRAGLLDEHGLPAVRITMRHAPSGIFWERAAGGGGAEWTNSKLSHAKLIEAVCRRGRVSRENVSAIAQDLGVSDRTVWSGWKEVRAGYAKLLESGVLQNGR